MAIEMKDTAPRLRGAVELKIYKNGVLKEVDHDHNLIVMAGRTKLARLLGGGYAGHIDRIGVGTGSAPAADGDTGLTGAVYIPVSSAEYSAGKVRFNFTIGTDQANGLAIRELGLFFGDGTIFSRRVRKSVIGKENDIQITGYWEIYL
ncbi:hypothetical protein [Selenomonas bovis]|jgi:hypothetical protein|uniref:hypothetical protein n=1 Tax=Selenomonas bovis TaxID=416586 RepID=UPI0004E1B834|nr:hypothetical protein [Selenomonas bovis]